MSKHRHREPTRRYPRTARLAELIHEIVAEELERSDDARLELVTVTDVDVEADLRHATIWFSTLQGPEHDEEVLAALGEARVHLQAAIGRQARTKRTPVVSFRPDEVARSAQRIEQILREHPLPPDRDADHTEPAGEA